VTTVTTATTTTDTPTATAIAIGLDHISFQSPLPLLDVADSVDATLVDLYYSYFHHAHPFLVPRRLYHAQQYPRYLQLAVQFIGSHYASGSEGRGSNLHRRTEYLRDRVGHSILDVATHATDMPSHHRTVAMVQALTMLAIALHARHELAASDRAVARALQLAVDLGMHRREFAGARRSIRDESLRRTWWELYIVDGYLAALHHKSTFRVDAIVKNSGGTGGANATVLLPCEEAAFETGETGHLPVAPSLDDFDARLFSDDDDDETMASFSRFSSFAYRIDAVRLLGRVLAVTRMAHIVEGTSDTYAAVDSALAGWLHHLHPTKQHVVGRDGTVRDDVLFQAHMLVHYATLVLHCPRSDLVVTLPAASRITCGQADGGGLSPTASSHLHAAKATRASTHLTGLAALCSPVVQEHTPFFVCGLLLGATVQLAACASRPVLRWQFRDSVLLAIGVLKTLGRTWALAHNALRLLRDVAGEVLQHSIGGSAHGGGGIHVDVDTEADADAWQARLIHANTAHASDDALAEFSDLMPSPGQLDLEQLNQLDQLEQWTLPLMLQLDDHQSSHSTSLC
jgi:hypothetical protein